MKQYSGKLIHQFLPKRLQNVALPHKIKINKNVVNKLDAEWFGSNNNISLKRKIKCLILNQW